MASIRLPRFKRSSNVPSIRFTERDHEILRHVHRHRFLRSDHLTALLPGSRQQTLRRLQLLYHHGHLDRPRCQIEYYHRGGSRSIAYGLGNKGAGLLKRELSTPMHRLDWPNKNRVARLFLEHALLISEVMVALERSCAKSESIRLIREEELLAKIKLRDPFRWTVNVHSHRLGLRPDKVFGLENMRTGERSYYFLEADRGTMPVARRNLSQSSFQRKLLTYEATWQQDIHRTRFGFHRFRALTVTTNHERLQHLLQACGRIEHGHGLFLFTDTKTLHAQADFLSLRWKTWHAGETANITV